MTWKDKLEIGLKDDAPFRRDNLPEGQKHAEVPDDRSDDPSRSPEDPEAREDARRAAVTHPPVRTGHRKVRPPQGRPS